MSNNREIALPGNAINLFVDTEFSSLNARVLLSIGLLADARALREGYAAVQEERFSD